MKKRTTLITIILMMIISLFPFNTKALDSDKSISEFDLYSEGLQVSSIKLSTSKQVSLNTTEVFDEATSFQWQILNLEEEWVDVQNQTDAKVIIDYLMIKEMIKDDVTFLRLVTSDEKRKFSKKVKVSVSNDTSEVKQDKESINKVNKNEDLENENITSQMQATNDGGTSSGTNPDFSKLEVRIQYVIADEYGEIEVDGNTGYSRVAPCFTIETVFEQFLTQTVDSPKIPGYAPNQSTVRISEIIKEPKIISVIYRPIEVMYKINHLHQKIDKGTEILDSENQENYIKHETTEHYGKTGDKVANSLEKTYEGFEHYNYIAPTIAADGSTEVNIYYSRKYVLLELDLDGGYGSESRYAPYESEIGEIIDPIKPGYEFIGWRYAGQPITSIVLPQKMPAEDRTYTAVYKPDNLIKSPKVDIRLIFWHQDADNLEEYYIASEAVTKVDLLDDNKNQNKVKSSNYQNFNVQSRKDYKHFVYNHSVNSEVEVNADGSTVLNLYYNRKDYTIKFFTQNFFNILTLKAEYTGPYGSVIPNTKIRKINDLITSNNKWYKDGQVIYLSDFDKRVMGHNASYIDGGIGTTLYSTKINYCLKDKFNDSACEKITSSLFQTRALNSPFNNPETPKLTSDEVFRNIKGYTRDVFSSSINFDGLFEPRENEYNINYIKNKHKVKFYNHNEFLSDREKEYSYDEKVSQLNNTQPKLPKNLEDESHTFLGWYIDSNFKEKFDFTKNFNMPDNDVVLFAKWQKNKYQVEFKYDNQEPILDINQNPISFEIGHRDSLSPYQSSVLKDFKLSETRDFHYWYFKIGEKKIAFNENMLITENLVLYPKFRKDKAFDKKTTLSIVYKDELGKEFNNQTVSDLYIGSTITVNASLASVDCNGIFPTTLSKSIIIKPDNNNYNKIDFTYKASTLYKYTVEYKFYEANGQTLINEADIPIKTPKSVETYNDIVTETYVPVADYTPKDNNFIKSLTLSTLSAEERVIVFEYTKIQQKTALVKFNYFTEKLSQTASVEYEIYDNENLTTEYEKVISSSLNIKDLINHDKLLGFSLSKINNDNCTQDSCNYNFDLTAEGLVFDLYFNRNSYEYTVRYLENENPIENQAELKTNAKYGQTISGDTIVEGVKLGKVLEDYNYNNSNPETLTIGTENEKNILNLHYTEKTVNIIYKVEGDAGSGAVKLGDNGDELQSVEENLKYKTGEPSGAIPIAKPGYRFAGWCTVPGCDGSGLEKNPGLATVVNNKITPKRPLDKIIRDKESFTFYAVFVKDIADLKITKTLLDPITVSESFLFHVEGSKLDNQTKAINLTVSINIETGKSGEVIIKDLPVGKYEITQLNNWSWNYKDNADKTNNGIETIDLVYDKESIQNVPFSSKLNSLKWLRGDSYTAFSLKDLLKNTD